MLFLVAVISFPLRFFVKSSSHCIDTSTLSWMLAYPLLPSFLGTYSLSTSFLGCMALYIVMISLSVCSICWSSYLVHFRNCSVYLSRYTTYVFIPLIFLLQYRFVSSRFLALQRFSFFILYFIYTCLIVSDSNIPKYS